MTQETHYCSICGNSNHEVSELAFFGEKAICSVCVDFNVDFKKNVESLLSVSSSSCVKTAGIDVQTRRIIAAIESVHRQCCGMDGKVDSEQIKQKTENKERWTIDIKGDLYIFCREINGVVNESYKPLGRDIAAIYAAAIIQGFEPPRQLKEKDCGLTSHQVRLQDNGSR